MKTAWILLLSVAAVGVISYVLVSSGSWLVCAGICVAILVGLTLGERHEL